MIPKRYFECLQMKLDVNGSWASVNRRATMLDSVQNTQKHERE